MSEEEKGFRVIDRRGSTEEKSVGEGAGFVMKEPKGPEAEVPPPIDFSTLVFSLATGAFINMGLAPDPSGKKAERNLPLARQDIEILELLRTKTKGNLSADETQLMDSLIAELKLRFVEASR